MTLEIRRTEDHELADFSAPILAAFGMAFLPERLERTRMMSELEIRLGAFEGATLVGSAGAYSFAMTVPGGAALDITGLTMVAVLPTHRRRGVLTRLMLRHLDDARAEGRVVSALFASEGPIYGRFGYGMASLMGEIELARSHAVFADRAPIEARARFVAEADAPAAFNPIWDRVRAVTPGMLSRSPGWWRARRIMDPDWLRAGRAPLQRVILEVDGRPAAYALYRLAMSPHHNILSSTLDVVEAIGDSPAATRALWRWLFDLDLVELIKAPLLSVDHPLHFLLADPRRMRMQLSDALWVRLVDVAEALSRRGYAAGAPLVLEVTDAFCPWNAGRYRLADGVAARTADAPDLALDVDALGSAYLGGFSFTQLALAGRAHELTPGALGRADALFRADRAPWCPEVF